MKIYTLETNYDKIVYTKNDAEDDIDKYYEMIKGKEVDLELFKDFVVRYKNKSKKNALVVNLPGSFTYAANETFKTALEAIPQNNIQFIPVKNEFDSTIYLINPLTVLDIYDEETKEDDFISGTSKVKFTQTENLPPIFLCQAKEEIPRVIYVTQDFVDAMGEIDCFTFRCIHKEYEDKSSCTFDNPVYKMDGDVYKKMNRLLRLLTQDNIDALFMLQEASQDLIRFILVNEKEAELLEIEDYHEIISRSSFKKEYFYDDILNIILLKTGYMIIPRFDKNTKFVNDLNSLAEKWNVKLGEKAESYEGRASTSRRSNFIKPMTIALEKKGMGCFFYTKLISAWAFMFKLENAQEIANLGLEIQAIPSGYINDSGYLENKTLSDKEKEKLKLRDLAAPTERIITKSRSDKFIKFAKKFTGNDKNVIDMLTEGSRNIIGFYEKHKDIEPFSIVTDEKLDPSSSYPWCFLDYREATGAKLIPLDYSFLFHVLEYYGYLKTFYWYNNKSLCDAAEVLCKKYGVSFSYSLFSQKELEKPSWFFGDDIMNHITANNLCAITINRSGHYLEPFNQEHYPFKLFICSKAEAQNHYELICQIADDEVKCYGFVPEEKPAEEKKYLNTITEIAEKVADEFVQFLEKKFPLDGKRILSRAFIQWYYPVFGGQYDLSFLAVDSVEFEKSGDNESSADYDIESKYIHASKQINKIQKLADKENNNINQGGNIMCSDLAKILNSILLTKDFSKINTSSDFKIPEAKEYD